MAENNSFLQAEECDFNKILVWIWKNNKTQNIFETIIYNFPRKVKISTINMKVNMLMGSFFGAPDLFFVSIEHKLSQFAQKRFSFLAIEVFAKVSAVYERVQKMKSIVEEKKSHHRIVDRYRKKFQKWNRGKKYPKYKETHFPR